MGGGMTEQIRIEIPGAPHGKGRPRFARQGAFVRTYTDEKTVNYETMVKLSAKEAMAGRPLLDGAVEVVLNILVAVPASWSKRKRAQALAGDVWPTTKPDVDNVLKAIADALNGVVWHDDKQITDVVIRKRYAEKPTAVVYVRPASNPGF